MPTAQHEHDLLAIAPREGELTGFAETFELAMGSGNLIQGRCAGALRVIVGTILAVEFSDRFD
jgi:hypothetical protein